MAMRSGFFQTDLATKPRQFNSSIGVDQAMYPEDIEGSMAHVKMLGVCGLISQEEARALSAALLDIKSELDSGALKIDPDAEDIHLFIEEELTKRLGPAGKKVHTARSRNDQVALDLRLHLRKKTKQQMESLKALIEVLLKIAKEHVHSLMPGFTHLQAAQPVSLAHHLLAYAQMFLRDLQKLQFTLEELDESPLGCGALAGTALPIDRALVMEELGFSSLSANSIDAVSNRDFVLQLSHSLCMIQLHYSRLCEEIILWNSQGFRFVKIHDAYATGSSMMPQKKNPDMAELIRGKSGRLFGNHMGLLTMMKGLPLSYNKDMQEDKEMIFDSVETVLDATEVLTGMMETMVFNTETMKSFAENSLLNATDCADYLVRKGMPFREAYEAAARLSDYCLEEEKTLNNLQLEEFTQFSELFGTDIYEAISLKNSLENRACYGGPAPAKVFEQIGSIEKILADNF